MNSRDLLPALRAVRDQTIGVASTHDGLAGEETPTFAAWVCKHISDAALLQIADKAVVPRFTEADYEKHGAIMREVTELAARDDERRKRLGMTGDRDPGQPSPSPALIVAYGVAARERASWWRNPHPSDAWFLALWEQVKASQIKCDPEQLFYQHPGECEANAPAKGGDANSGPSRSERSPDNTSAVSGGYQLGEQPSGAAEGSLTPVRAYPAKLPEPPKYCCYKGEAEATQLRMCASHSRDREIINKALLARGKREAFGEAAKMADAEADAIEQASSPQRGMDEHDGGRCAAYRTAAALIRSRARAEEGAK